MDHRMYRNSAAPLVVYLQHNPRVRNIHHEMYVADQDNAQLRVPVFEREFSIRVCVSSTIP